MPADMLSPELQHPIETKTEQADPLLASKKDILKAFDKGDATADDIAKLDKLTGLIKTSMDEQTAKEFLSTLSKPEGQKRCKDLRMPYVDFIGAAETFVKTKYAAAEDYGVADIKTFCEQKSLSRVKQLETQEELNNIEQTKLKSIDQHKNDILSTAETNAKILASIEEKTLKNAEQIKKSPGFDEAKQKLEASTNQKIPDEYFVTRFALQHAGEPGAILSDTDLGGLKKYDLIASLDAKYGIQAVIPTQEEGFVNNRMDGVIASDIQQKIDTDAGVGFDALFTAGEVDFFQKDSPLRERLMKQTDALSTPAWLQEDQLAKYKLGTSPDAVIHEERNRSQPDLVARLPQDILRDPNPLFAENKFVTWIATMQKQGLFPARVTTLQARKYFQEYTKINTTKVENRTSQEAKWHRDFLSLLATTQYKEAIHHKNTLQDASTKSIAEAVFQDATQLVAADMPGAEKWKIVPDATTKQHFVIDADGAMHINYMLNGVPGKITVDKDGKVFMNPVLQQGESVTDVEYKKAQVGTIPSINAYTANIQAAVARDLNGRRGHTADQMRNDVQAALIRDPQAISVTKATMQTAMARHSFIDALLTPTTIGKTNAAADKIKENMKKGSGAVVVEGNSVNQPESFQKVVFDSYTYSKTAGKGEMEKAQATYTDMQTFLRDEGNKELPFVKNIRENPEHIAKELKGQSPHLWPHILAGWKVQREAFNEQKIAKADIQTMEEKYFDTPGKDWSV